MNSLFIVALSLLTASSSVNLMAQDRAVEVTSERKSDNTVDIQYKKNMPGSYIVNIKFNSLSNTTAHDFEEVIKYDSGNLVTLRPENKNIGIGYGYSTSYRLGNNKPKADTLFQYLLPFKVGKKVTVYESSNVSEKYFGAEKIETWKSYNVNSKTPDSIYAMRKGIVVQLINDYKTDTLTNMVYTSKKNTILVEHEDGTYASYKGFKKDSFTVKLGDIVYPSTMIGVLDRFNNKRYVLHFNIYYHDISRTVDNTNATLKTQKTPYLYVTPYFFTKEGLIKIVPKSSFTSEINEGIITKELSKKEIKQRLKTKAI